MAMLLFYAGENRFAINCASIVRVVPHVNLEKVPDRSPVVAGVMVLGREPIPVIDFCQIIENRPAHPFLSSRIILLKDSSGGSERCIGLLGEKVEEVIDLRSEQFDKSEFYFRRFPYLEKGYTDKQGIIHFIHLEEFFRFLSAEVFQELSPKRNL